MTDSGQSKGGTGASWKKSGQDFFLGTGIKRDICVALARVRLHGPGPWDNAAVARSEAVWPFAGFDQVLLSAALRRARLWCLDPDDLCAYAFRENSEDQIHLRKR